MMTTTRPTATRLLTALALAAGLTAAHAQTPPASQPAAAASSAWHHGMPMRGGMDHATHAGLPMLLRRVHATPEQRDKIRAIVRDAMQQARPQRQQLRDLGLQELRLLAADPIDQDAVLKLAQQRQTLVDQMAQQHTRTELAVAAVLTPQQRQQALQMLQHRMAHPMHAMHPAQP